MESTDKAPRNLTDQELWNQLDRAISLRSSQDDILWTIFGIFWAANSILLVALFSTGQFPQEIVIRILASVGASLSLMWYLIQSRTLGHIKRYEVLMSRIESRLDFEPSFALSIKINKLDYEEHVVGKHLWRNPQVRRIMSSCILAGFTLWILVFLVAPLLAATRN